MILAKFEYDSQSRGLHQVSTSGSRVEALCLINAGFFKHLNEP